MNRRQFVFGLTLAAFRVPLAEAQALGKVFRVGFLATTTPIAELVSDPTNPFNSGFRREMRDRVTWRGRTSSWSFGPWRARSSAPPRPWPSWFASAWM
jgi:hypothetical protein